MSDHFKSRNMHSHTGGFTLVELMIVIVILGVLAALVVPMFSSAAGEARENSLKMNLHRIRTQINIYRNQHTDFPSLENFEDQMTMASNYEGDTEVPGTEGYTLGPYMTSVPVNPNNKLATVTNGDAGTSGWYYDEDTGDFFANDAEESRLF